MLSSERPLSVLRWFAGIPATIPVSANQWKITPEGKSLQELYLLL